MEKKTNMKLYTFYLYVQVYSFIKIMMIFYNTFVCSSLITVQNISNFMTLYPVVSFLYQNLI